MKFFALPNLSSNEVEVVSPASVKPAVDSYPDTKEEFRKWCNEISTKHCFYSAVEGLTPSLRVTTQNPPLMMHGLIVDYDSAHITQEMIDGIKDVAAAGMMPTWVSRTYSRGARLVFEFQEPILVDNEELADRFLKHLSKELNLKALLPGLDPTSFKRSQYFELGRAWKPIEGGKPISSEFLGLLVFKAATEKKIHGDVAIPIEEVAAEVERRWPGRCRSFNPGDRIPLFWVEPFVERIGAQVGDQGIICYSERAGKSFLSWGEILGNEFVRNYEASRIGAAAAGLYYDGKLYWRKHENGKWIPKVTEECIRDLKVRGINGTKDPKQTASDVDKVLVAAQAFDLSGAVPFVHNKEEFVNVNGHKYLNINTKRVVQPAEQEGPFPWLEKFFANIWDSPDQRDYFLAWFQRFYRSAYDGCLESGQALVIAGEANRGKTLLSKAIIGEALGGSTDASKYLLGETSFNKEAAEVALWRVDDSKGSATWEKHAEFSNALKATVANPQASYHPKFRDSMLIPWSGRIVLTCNDDARSLDILPAMDNTVADKIMLFKFGKWQAKFLPNAQMEALIKAELPYFLRWLLAWKPPEHVLDPENPRFGVKPFHHPDLLRTSEDASPEARLRELLQIWRRVYRSSDTDEPKWMSASEIRNGFAMAGLANDLREFGRNRLGQALRTMGPEYVLDVKTEHKVTRFLIKLSDE